MPPLQIARQAHRDSHNVTTPMPNQSASTKELKKANHTFRIRKSNGATLTGFPIVEDANGYFVAEVQPHFARLIAASPTLLCMLQRLLDEVMTNEECFSRIAPLTLEQARAAIQSATL